MPASPAAAPQAISRPGTHEKIVSLFAGETPGLVLDVPAGEGALTVRLRQLGFRTVCLELCASRFKVTDTPVLQADMNAPFPVATGKFDYVVCADGIEHFENPRHAVREFARALKPGGKVVLSFPNMLNVEQRVRLLHFGFSAHFKPNAPDHFNPLPYFEVHTILEQHGFRITTLTTNRIKKGSWILLPLYLWIKLITAFVPRAKQQRYCLPSLTSVPVLLGEKIILKAEKHS